LTVTIAKAPQVRTVPPFIPCPASFLGLCPYRNATWEQRCSETLW
jgi:hypothetical protein